MRKIKTGRLIIAVIMVAPFLSVSQSTLNIKAFVEGYYTDTSGLMKAVIDPVSQPALFDTITVELHNPSDTVTSFSEKVVFNTDGTAAITLPPTVFGNFYYLVLKHRNSIETWSKMPVLITIIANYDFTTAVTQAFNDNLKWVSNAACIYSGDINNDNAVNSLDMDIVDSLASNFTYGYYINADLNGDSVVDALDMIYVDMNLTLGVNAEIPVITHVDDTGQNLLSVYPNPASTVLNVHPFRETAVYIYDAAGRTVENIAAVDGMLQIDVSSWNEGVYYLVKGSGRNEGQKIVIRR